MVSFIAVHRVRYAATFNLLQIFGHTAARQTSSTVSAACASGPDSFFVLLLLIVVAVVGVGSEVVDLVFILEWVA